MHIFSFAIASDLTDSNCPSGFVRANNLKEAFQILANLEANLYQLPADVSWPGDNGESIWWGEKIEDKTTKKAQS